IRKKAKNVGTLERARSEGPALATPLQIVDFPVGFMTWIDAPQLQAHAMPFQSSVDPTGSVAVMKNICDRGQVDEMNSAGILLDLPVMGVSVNVGLHLFARANNL